MTTVLSFDGARDSLAEIVASKNVLLVVGAGASASSGGPLARDLVRSLGQRFPQADIDANMELFAACREVEDTPAYGRQDLVEFVTGMLLPLQPSDSYKQIPRIRWRALFTTNYDDLIEKAYASPARVQTLQPIPIEYRASLPPRDNHVQLHYLMGSVRERYDRVGAPVLTWSDYTRTLQDRVPIMQLFQNTLADGGKVIYVGYSFNDLVFEGILDEAARRIGQRNVPYGHAILSDWPHDRRRGFHRIATRQVVPVEGSFEDFGNLLKQIADGDRAASGVIGPTSVIPAVESPAAGKRFTLNNLTLSLTEGEASVYSEALELLDDSVTKKPALGREAGVEMARAFFRGATDGWAPFAFGYPFHRAAYEQVIRSVIDRCRSQTRSDAVILVHGPAALGKSVMARQLAFDLFTKHGIMSAIAKPTWRARPDIKLLNRLFDDLEIGLPEGEVMPPIVLIVDQAELLDRTIPDRLSAFLRSQHRQHVLVLFARTNEYYRSGVLSNGFDVDAGEKVALSDRIEKAEVRELIRHLQAIGLWRSDRVTAEAFWQERVEIDFDSSFFDVLYSLVEDTQEPLRERVWSEFQELGKLGQEAYLLVAAVHQFGLPLKMEILMRALDVEYALFEQQVVKSDAREILFSEHASDALNLYFRGRTRLISSLVFDRALPTPGAQLPTFIKFVRSVNPGDMFGTDELDTLRTLLVQVIGPSGFDRRFSLTELSELFAAATSVVQDDVLEHHFGIVEKEAGRLLSAREHLSRALELAATLPHDLSSLRESPQNIENSLANVLGLLAIEALKRNDEVDADRLFDEARDHFVNARAGAFPNTAAYDAHARMLLTRAKRRFKEGSATRALAMADVLEVTSEGIDNVNDISRIQLVELQAEVMNEMGLTQEAQKELEERAKLAGPRERARYEVLLAQVAVGGTASDAKRKSLRRGYSHAVSACEADGNYFAAWKIRAQIHRLLFPMEKQELQSMLESALRCPDATDNLWVYYELAVVQFEARRYDNAATAFAKLRRISGGHAKRESIVERAGEREGAEPYEFDGRVVHREKRAGFLIRCDELSAFGDIFFNPRAEKFYSPRVGDKVSFVVGLTYRGPVAVDVRQL